MDRLVLNSKFNGFNNFLEAKRAYEEASKSLLVIRDSKKIKGDTDVSRQFHYDYVVYRCKAGDQRPTDSKGLRTSSTYKMNCNVQVHVKFTGTDLMITKSELNHNGHSLDQKTFDHYPENMKLSTENEEKVAKMLSIGGNKRKIKAEIMKETGKPVMMKTIHNIDTKRLNKLSDGSGNCLKKLYDILVTIPGAHVRFISNEQDEFVGIFYQEERMWYLYNKYPEVILFDATYKTNNLNLALFIQLCIDSNGETEIVSLYICQTESREGIGAMLEVFKEFNPNWRKTKVFIGDKDFADRSVYLVHFPDAVLQICLYHVFVIFNREITTAKRQITIEQRKAALEILQKLTYSQSRHQYEELYNQLSDLNLEHVMTYFNDNWHNIQEEWTVFGRNQYAYYCNTTNNRSERINRTIKGLGNRNSNLLVFFENLNTTVYMLSSEKDIKAIRSTMKVERKRFTDPALEGYHRLLTPFAYKKVEEQFEFYEKYTIQLSEITAGVYRSQSGYVVTSETCSCSFFKSMKLICRHIFQLLKHESLDMFAPTICLFRWTKQCYYQSHPALGAHDEVIPQQPISVQRIKVPDEVSKYKKTATVTKEINSYASSMPPDQYNHFMEKLKTLRDEIKNPGNQHENILEFTERATIDYVGTAAKTQSNTVTITNVPEPTSNPNLQNQRNDVSVIKMPDKIASKGRPKGTVNTVIGLKKKSKTKEEATPPKRKFLDLDPKSQSLAIISWLTNKTATQILSRKVESHEIIQDPVIFNRLRNDAVDISSTKTYFEKKTFKYLRDEVEKLDGKPWHCVKCKRNLSGDQIMCHGCLDWYHVSCTVYTREGNKDFFCTDCKLTPQL